MIDSKHPTAHSQQIIIVTSQDWTSDTGILQRYERSNINAIWKKIDQKVKVVLGKNGMGWGIGLHGDQPLTERPKIVAEGSKRSPVGAIYDSICFRQIHVSKLDSETSISTYF